MESLLEEDMLRYGTSRQVGSPSVAPAAAAAVAAEDDLTVVCSPCYRRPEFSTYVGFSSSQKWSSWAYLKADESSLTHNHLHLPTKTQVKKRKKK